MYLQILSQQTPIRKRNEYARVKDGIRISAHHSELINDSNSDGSFSENKKLFLKAIAASTIVLL